MQYWPFALEAHPVAYASFAAEGEDAERPPTVPTLEEIEMADRLRHDLELKYLGFADPCPSLGPADVSAPRATDPQLETPTHEEAPHAESTPRA